MDTFDSDEPIGTVLEVHGAGEVTVALNDNGVALLADEHDGDFRDLIDADRSGTVRLGPVD